MANFPVYAVRFEMMPEAGSDSDSAVVGQFTRFVDRRWDRVQRYIGQKAIGRHIQTPIIGPERNDTLWVENGQLARRDTIGALVVDYTLARYMAAQRIEKTGNPKPTYYAEMEMCLATSAEFKTEAGEDLLNDVADIMKRRVPKSIRTGKPERLHVYEHESRPRIYCNLLPAIGVNRSIVVVQLGQDGS